MAQHAGYTPLGGKSSIQGAFVRGPQTGPRTTGVCRYERQGLLCFFLIALQDALVSGLVSGR